jgi:hypothetical protein
MILPIEQDTQRFRQIVRGQVKQNLRKFMSNGELIGRLGRELEHPASRDRSAPLSLWRTIGRCGAG